MKRYLYLSLALAAALAACSPKGETIPEEPDYADTTQWYIADRSAAVDVFYIVSTECDDYTLGGKPMHYADTRNDSIRALLYGEMEGVDRLLAGELNYYSPYYRQVTMETYTSDSLVEARMSLAYGDVRRAFDYYMEHYNNGRPFILAGFSQGAMAVVDLLKAMDDETYRRLVAAYVIGYKVTDTNAHIRPAKDSADLGVTICYNSVKDNSCAVPILSDGNLVAINPVSWSTDDTPATLIDPRYGDTLTVTLDTTSLLLHIDGYTRNDYMLPLIGCEGNYHCLEISLFSDVLRRNIALRAITTQTSRSLSPR
ncbi:MAG: DUF3089 domain-containing protein [Bacteroidales bacterium]|nr:DUF3089 domain-containing protein [Bacteroidales bacterium]